MGLALLRTEHDGTPLPVGDAEALESGQPLVLVGHPTHFGDWTTSLGRSVYGGTALADAGVDGTEADAGGRRHRGRRTGSPVAAAVRLHGRRSGTGREQWLAHRHARRQGGRNHLVRLAAGSGAMETGSDEPFVSDQPIAPRAHSSNHHTVGAIDDWLDERR